MQFALLVLGAPYSSQANETAFRFACAALESGHRIYRVFFYQDGVYCAFSSGGGSGEINFAARWQELRAQHQLDLIACVGAGTRRGLPETAAQNSGRAQLADGFELGGLGQLIDAAVQADRLVIFGG